MLNNLKKIPQTNEVLNKKRLARELLNMLEPIRNTNNNALLPTIKAMNNSNKRIAQMKAAEKLANSYMRNGKMYPSRNGNMEALIRHYFSNDINVNRAKKHMNTYITKPSLLTTRVGRVRSFINQLKKQQLKRQTQR
jgi:hypothetical protein